MNCLQGFKEESSRNEHISYCVDNESVKVEMPQNNPRVQYSDGQFQFKVPFIMYVDFESTLQLEELIITFHLDGVFDRSEFAYGNVQSPLKLYRGKDCVKKFCDHVIGEARRLYQSFPEVPMIPLTPNLFYYLFKILKTIQSRTPYKRGAEVKRIPCIQNLFTKSAKE